MSLTLKKGDTVLVIMEHWLHLPLGKRIFTIDSIYSHPFGDEIILVNKFFGKIQANRKDFEIYRGTNE